MPLPSSGPLTLADIQAEFGGTNPISLSEYYAGGANVPAGTTGTYGAVPSSGAISIRNFYGTSKATFRLDTNTYTDLTFDPGTAGVTLAINSNGTLTATGTNAGTLDSYNWITPTTGSTSYYVRATLIGGSFSSGTTGTWLALTSNRTWNVTQSGAGTQTANATFEIASDAAGTNVVASANIILTADVL